MTTLNSDAYLIVVVVVVICTLATFFPDGDLDSLRRKTLAKLSAVTDTRKLLRRVDLEDVAKDRRKNGGLALLDRPLILRVALGLDVDEREPKSVQAVLSVITPYQR